MVDIYIQPSIERPIVIDWHSMTCLQKLADSRMMLDQDVAWVSTWCWLMCWTRCWWSVLHFMLMKCWLIYWSRVNWDVDQGYHSTDCRQLMVYTWCDVTNFFHFLIILQECSYLHHLNGSENRCHFVKSNKSCEMSEGFIQYIKIPYCSFPTNLVPLALFLLVC